jgi:thymidine kinase
MFSGKTEELIRRLKRVKIANLRFRIFKPVLDTRFDTLDIVSHDENAIVSTPVQSAKEIIALAEGNDVVGIDEAQFFDNALADVCDELALSGIRVIVAGLDMDYSGKPFGPIPSLLAKADFITKLHAICVKCGQLASHSFRKSGDGNQILLGATETYEPRCRKCFNEDQLH